MPVRCYDEILILSYTIYLVIYVIIFFNVHLLGYQYYFFLNTLPSTPIFIYFSSYFRKTNVDKILGSNIQLYCTIQCFNNTIFQHMVQLRGEPPKTKPNHT
jgi:hypothetical protein